MLKWARKKASFSIEGASKEMNLSQDDLTKIEKGKKDITMKQLWEFGNLYDCNYLSFYLKEIPKEVKIKKFETENHIVEFYEDNCAIIESKNDLFNLPNTMEFSYEEFEKIIKSYQEWKKQKREV